jgi:hypothetical protein
MRKAAFSPIRSRLAALLLGVSALASAAPPSDTGAPHQITWGELVPKGWDATQGMRDVDLAKLQDNDPRANELLVRMREVADSAPTNPALAGQLIRVNGFIVPLEESRGEITEFLLVPYFGACIHSPPPPANQIIHVKNAPRSTGLRSMDIVSVTGKLQITRADTLMGVSGYHVSADSVVRYAGAGAK